MTARSGALRRRRKPSLAARLKIAWVFIVVVIGLTAYGGYVLVTLPQFRVADLRVNINGIAVNEREVTAAAGVDRRKNMWLLDTTQIARRIEAIPYVDHAAVERTFPARMSIEVTEREPAACVHGAADNVTIDEAQRVLQRGCARASAVAIDVPDGTLGVPGSFARSSALRTLLDADRTLRAAGLPVRRLRTDSYGGLIAVDTRGIQLLFGSPDGLAAKAKLVGPVIAATPPGRAIKAIDLRAPTIPTVEFR